MHLDNWSGSLYTATAFSLVEPSAWIILCLGRDEMSGFP